MLFREILKFNTKKGISFEDVTDSVKKVVSECDIEEGICNLFLTATTAGIMINENERMLMEDFRLMFQDLVDDEKPRLHPSGAVSHMRSSFLDVTKNLPISSLGIFKRRNE